MGTVLTPKFGHPENEERADGGCSTEFTGRCDRTDDAE